MWICFYFFCLSLVSISDKFGPLSQTMLLARFKTNENSWVDSSFFFSEKKCWGGGGQTENLE